MTQDEQIDDLQFKVTNIVDYYHKEFDIPYHAIIGVLEEVKRDYIETRSEIIFEVDDDDDDDADSWKCQH